MILRTKEGFLKVGIDNFRMKDFFDQNIGHWGPNPFDSTKSAYIIDRSVEMRYGPIAVTLFKGDVFVEK